MTTETVAARLDREVRRLTDTPEESRPSMSFIDGVDHAANLVSRMPATLDRADVVAALLTAYAAEDAMSAPTHAVLWIARRLGMDLEPNSRRRSSEGRTDLRARR